MYWFFLCVGILEYFSFILIHSSVVVGSGYVLVLASFVGGSRLTQWVIFYWLIIVLITANAAVYKWWLDDNPLASYWSPENVCVGICEQKHMHACPLCCENRDTTRHGQRCNNLLLYVCSFFLYKGRARVFQNFIFSAPTEGLNWCWFLVLSSSDLRICTWFSPSPPGGGGGGWNPIWIGRECLTPRFNDSLFESRILVSLRVLMTKHYYV